MFTTNIRHRVVIVMLMVLFLFCISINHGKAATGINQVTISNVRDVAFVVSWATTFASNGSVDWGTSTLLGNTVSDIVNSTTTHYVIISGLLPNTTYYFQVTSGDETDNNHGAYYQVTTGPSLSPSLPALTVWGYMYLADETTAVPNAVVYLRLHDLNGIGSSGSSQIVSARTDGTGVWSYALENNVLTGDFQGIFSYTRGADNLQVIGQGGGNGSVGYDPTWIINIPTTDPTRQDVILSQDPTPVLVSSFTGNIRFNKVQLDWETFTEVRLVGFNVYRSYSLDGLKQKLNINLLPAQKLGQMAGASYHFEDTVQPGQHYNYWLELVMTDATQIIEPVSLDSYYWIFLPSINR